MPGYQWVKYTGERSVKPQMISVGGDLDGSPLVVGRAQHEGLTLPAKVKPEHGVAYVTHGEVEHMKHDFEILMPLEFHWVPAEGGFIPNGAVEGGKSRTGGILYIARTKHDNVPVIGHIDPIAGHLCAPYNGSEVCYEEYEVLVHG